MSLCTLVTGDTGNTGPPGSGPTVVRMSASDDETSETTQAESPCVGPAGITMVYTSTKFYTGTTIHVPQTILPSKSTSKKNQAGDRPPFSKH